MGMADKQEWKVTHHLLKYVEEFKSPYMPDVNKYEKIAKIGQGTFGEVFKAKNKETGQLVALKKILMENEKEGFPITALREIKMLQQLRDEHITELIEICGSTATAYNRGRSTFYLVFTFCEHDLAGLLSNTSLKFQLSEVKQIMKQMFEGLFKIHSNKILHRDMKAANVLINKEGVLKLADFGLARPLIRTAGAQEACYTNRVVTLWYRPPELLLGERSYGKAIDIWGAGCIMAELWTRSPIMQGETEQRQLQLICQLCGSINKEVWPGVERLLMYNKIELTPDLRRRVRERLQPYVSDPKGVDLIDKLLILDPSKRIDTESALNHDFFWSDPMPSNLKRLMGEIKQSMFEYTAPRNRGRGQHPHGRGAAAGGAAPQGQFVDKIY